MKNNYKILLATICQVFFSINIQAQFSGSSPYYFTTSGDKFGFNTYPAYLIDVKGDINLVSSAGAYKYDGTDFLKLTNTNNILLGLGAGATSMSGDFNVLVGGYAGQNNTNGNLNSFFGHYSGNLSVNGDNNSFFGGYAGSVNISGYNNSFFGTYTGSANTGGFNNSYFGYGAYGDPNIYNSTAIGANAYVQTNNSIVLGDGIANVGINNSAPTYKLDVGGDIRSTSLAGGGAPVFADASGKLTVTPIDNIYWNINGNGLTTPGTHFIGTRDPLDFVFKTNNMERMRLTGTGGELIVQYNANIGPHLGVNMSFSSTDALVVGGNSTFTGNTTVTGNENINGDATIGSLATGLTTNVVLADPTGKLIISSAGVSNWLATGNGGTNPGTSVGYDFIGTTDLKDFVIATNYLERIRVKDNGDAIFGNNLGIGGGTPAYKLDVTGGDINLTGGVYRHLGFHILSQNVPNQNVFIGSGSTGLSSASFSGCTFTGYNAGTANYGNDNTYIGNSAGTSASNGVENTFIGSQSGMNATTSSANANTYIGFKSGYASSGTGAGDKNTFVGHKAGYNITTGGLNTVMGKDAGLNLTGGYYNTFIGEESGLNNTTQGHITVTGIGTYTIAGGDQLGNTFLGHKSGRDNTIGDANVFSGSYSGLYNTVGIFNSFYGHRAGESNMNGSENTMIGNFTGLGGSSSGSIGFCTTCDLPVFEGNVFVGSGSGQSFDHGGNTYVGTNTLSLGGENVLLGYYATAGGAVPGTLPTSTTPPWAAVNNSIAIGSYATVTSNNTMALGGTATSGPLGSTREVTVVIGQQSQVGPSGTPLAGTSSGAGFNCLETNGDVLVGGAIYYASDKRFKKSISDFTDAKEIIRKLHPVKYEYRDDIFFKEKGTENNSNVKMRFASGEQIGFLAQELQQYLPQCVKERGDGYLSVNYNQLFGVVIEGLKEQDSDLTQQKSEIVSLKIENFKLWNSINDLNERISQLEKGNIGIEKINKTGSDKIGLKTGELPADYAANKKSYLEQNVPNPYKDKTTIGYYLTSNTQKASLLIFDMNGSLLKTIQINQFSQGAVQITGGELKPGMYFYSLIADDKEVDTKKMIILE